MIEELLAEYDLPWDSICYIGDDIIDLGLLKYAGLAVTPSDAVPEAPGAGALRLRTRGAGAVQPWN